MSSIKHETLTPLANTESPSSHPLSRFAVNLDAFISDGQKNEILRPHQRRVFDDVSKFLHDGETRGYIEMPTGTGKTVLFVSLAEAFSY
ncbi:DEAD/DEAH box helicase family protein, partial [Candidatus Saccharibacteria bacterium]|nr:DEAD/DEAH box helicase family protein [Candidatus Saccharibacteria bacterium]